MSYKLKTAFFLLYFFDPINFYKFKSFQETKATRSLRLKIKSLKISISKYFFCIFYDELKNEQNDRLLIKNFLINLEITNSILNQKLWKEKKNKKSLIETKTFFPTSLFRDEKTNLISTLECLEDFLNI